jgi:hypothetical protein
LLGIGRIHLIDPDDYSGSSRNRLVGYTRNDPLNGLKKVDIAARLVKSIDSTIEVNPIPESLISRRAFGAIEESDYVIGCLDHDGPRFVLNETCMAYGNSYVDLATDVPEPGVYGGRVFVSWEGASCLYCKELLDADDVRRYLSTPDVLEAEASAYGVPISVLGETGPSVVSLNGVIASLGMTELMVGITGLRDPMQLQTYRADLARTTRDANLPSKDCPYCKGMWQTQSKANIERYIA